MELNDDLMEWVEVDGVKYATQQEVAVRIRELEAELDALRQQQGEPVAEVVEIYEHRYFKCDVIVGSTPAIGTKLYREAAPRVPEGWKLVPVEPTEAMIFAGRVLLSAYPEGTGTWLPAEEAKESWSKMLAAAPQPPDCKSEIQSGDCDGDQP